MDKHAANRLSDLNGKRWPQIKELSQQAQTARLELFIGADTSWFEGHFPGHPVLAGVVQLNWATEIGKRLFDIHSDFLGVENLKFQRIIEPDTALELELEYSEKLNRIAFSYLDSEGTFSKGRIRFV